jgi:ATP/maltotriose-dependent transcriptional regulator MalT
MKAIAIPINHFIVLCLLTFALCACTQAPPKSDMTSQGGELDKFLVSIDPISASHFRNYLHLQQLFDSLEAAETAGDAEKALEHLSIIANNFRMSGHYHEGIRFYRNAISRLNGHEPDRFAEIYHGLAAIYYELFLHFPEHRHHLDSASTIAARAFQYAGLTGTAAPLSDALNLKGAINLQKGNYAEAIQQLKGSYLLKQELESDQGLAVLNNLSFGYYQLQLYDTALFYAGEAFSRATKAGQSIFVANSLEMLSKIHTATGDTATANTMLTDRQRLIEQDDILINSLMMRQLHLNYESRQDEKIILGLSSERYYFFRLSRILMVGILLLILVTITIFFMMRQKVKLHKAEIEQEQLRSDLAHGESQRHLLELRMKQQELTFYSLRQIAQSAFAGMLTDKLAPFIRKFSRKSDQADFYQIVEEIRREVNTDSMTELENMVKQMHSGFFEKLAEINPCLTRRELQFCALLRMNLSSKDIADLLKIELSTVDRTRYNIRKKLNLDPNQNLNGFLMTV